LKKAQGLSLTTIVIAALVIIVLIILIVIMSGRMNLFGDAYDSSDDDVMTNICMKEGAACLTPDKTTGTCPSGYSELSGEYIDCGGSQKCCKKN